MTVGHILEMIGGKLGAMEGRRVDGTPFLGEGKDELRGGLEDAGFNSAGKETMYSGIRREDRRRDLRRGHLLPEALPHGLEQVARPLARAVQVLTRQPRRDAPARVASVSGRWNATCSSATGQP